LLNETNHLQSDRRRCFYLAIPKLHLHQTPPDDLSWAPIAAASLHAHCTGYAFHLQLCRTASALSAGC